MWIRVRSRCTKANAKIILFLRSLPLSLVSTPLTLTAPRIDLFATSLSHSLSVSVNEPQNRIALRSMPNWD